MIYFKYVNKTVDWAVHINGERNFTVDIHFKCPEIHTVVFHERFSIKCFYAVSNIMKKIPVNTFVLIHK